MMWESAFKDVALDEKHPYNRKLACGGCTTWSVKGMARECHLGQSSVVEALKALLDAGYIQYAGLVDGENGPRRRWRVTHPDELEAVRYAISMMGPPSERFKDSLTSPLDDTFDLDGNVRSDDNADGGDTEVC